MRSTYTFTTALALAGAIAVGSAAPVEAACTRLGFTVNDYGKEGPTRDAKDLLDKHIAKKMAERGVQNYKVGPKDVKCELFLNFIVFDEHTCTAEATVCWDNEPAKPAESAAAPAPAAAAPPVSEPAPAAEAPPAAQPAQEPAAAAATVSAPPVSAVEPTSAAPSPAPSSSPPAQPAAAAPSEHPAAKKPDAPVEVYEKVNP